MVLITTSIIYVIIGLALLNYCSEWFIVGSSRLAKHFNISNFVIGATVVAFGTSLPEIITSVYASLIGLKGIATGNALGSNIANIGLVLGLSAIIYPIFIKHKNILHNGYIYALFVLIATILGYNGFDFIDGTILFFLLIGYVIYTIKKGGSCESIDDDGKKHSLLTSIIYTVLGLIGVILGSAIFVDGAKGIALFLGVSDKVIGFTLVAFGTSLPELVVSIAAAKRKMGEMILGNIIGSNIANIGGALGLSAIITTMPPVRFELGVNLLLSLLMVIFMSKYVILKYITKKDIVENVFSKINRIDGFLMVSIYLLFVLIVGGIIIL